MGIAPRKFTIGIGVVGLFGVIVFCGCRPSGPERVVISGEVTCRGEPLPEGQIRFMPKPGSNLPVSAAPIVNGKYVVEAKGGVPAGTYRVQITALRPDPRYRPGVDPGLEDLGGENLGKIQYLPKKYNERTELEITIDSGSGPVDKDYSLSE